MVLPTEFLRKHKSLSTLQGRTALFDFEDWVEKHLNGWRVEKEGMELREEGCRELRDAIKLYCSIASPEYNGDPEHMSVMVLTICSLWESLDQLAVSLFPILAEYSPLIPATLFRALVLPTRNQMERLHLFESYLLRRHKVAQKCSNPSIFSSVVNSRSFSVRTFATSDSMQQSRRHIEAEASRWREAALLKLSQAKTKYADLAKRQPYKCTCYWDGNGRYRWEVKCERCRIGVEMDDIKVSKFEWPLPERSIDIEAAIFELKIPASFRDWRDTTYEMVIRHLCSNRAEEKSATLFSFNDYTILQGESLPCGRMTWSSIAKPINSSHYGGPKSVQVTSLTQARDVCFPHASRYELFHESRPLSFPDGDSLRSKCTPTLPSGRYISLQQWVRDVVHTQNEVIARQSICHMDLDVHEFISFGSLRAGEAIQWMNIYRELIETNLTLSTHEVHILLSHAASQCGTSNDLHIRHAHMELESSTFCSDILEAISARLGAIADNWHEQYSLLTLAYLVRRVLSISGLAFLEIRTKCLQLLQKAMHIVLSWIQSLKVDAKTVTNPPAIQERLRHLALIGRLTFEVDPIFLDNLLLDSINMECLIVFHAVILEYSTTATKANTAQSVRMLTLRNDRLSAKLADRLGLLLVMDPSILSKGVKTLWPGLQASAPWTRQLLTPDWMECIQRKGERKIIVHFNTMTGELLVDCMPLGRLPRQICQDASYQRLFGEVKKVDGPFVHLLTLIPANIERLLYCFRYIRSGRFD
jgi:hypothetical protein